MLTLILFSVLQLVTPGEMACLGSIQGSMVPKDLYIAAVKYEGMATMASQGQILYLNGPKAALLKAGETGRVIRPEGKVFDPVTGEERGIYYSDLGMIRVEAVGRESATARVLLSCQGMLKGDLVVPESSKTPVEFSGDLSNALTPFPRQGLVSSILLGKDDVREMGAGQFCFIGLGSRDDVKSGDRFTIYRPQPPFNPQDLTTAGTGIYSSYTRVRNKLDSLLSNRKLPPEVLGDMVVVEVGESTSTAMIINSLLEIHIGDLVVKR